ncbi:MAG: hypothetical protein JSS83_11915 [Cyanobacteria bacterium SZAS LIN-3]|nr:hypothetical protein [Cyanobacteria bacterium SZAS LIN-3]
MAIETETKETELEKQVQAAPEAKAQAPKSFVGIVKSLASSYVIMAVLALFIIDFGLKLATATDHPAITMTPLQTPYRSWVWWNVRDFEKEKQAPDIVLLGSSLMMAAFHGGDAAMYNVPQNVAFHHKSVLLERLLKAQFKRDYSTFVFALGGEMASDAYAITDSLLTGAKQPKVIIYGIAPRDFMDHALSSPASTEIFKLMSRMGDLSDVAQESRGSIWEMGEYYLGQANFIYGHRPNFIYMQYRLTNEALRKICGYKNLDYVSCPLMIRKQAFLELPENNGPNEVLICPPSAADLVFMDNSGEYRYRYKNPNLKQFASQVGYLERLLKVSDKRGIKVILVNMPLTEENVALMPPNFYDSYMKTIESLTNKYQAQFLDLNDHKVFPKKYFGDTAHLNVPGGKHFMEVLAEKIGKDDRVAATIQNLPQTGQ